MTLPTDPSGAGTGREEPSASVALRHVVGWASMGAFLVFVFAMVTARGTLSTVAFLMGMCAPALTMIAHLNMTGCLTGPEKAVWRRQLWLGHRAVVAVWTYLLCGNLGSATRGLEGSSS
jgi:hypothetical protein